MSEPDRPPSFQENDLKLLTTGNFSDGIVKCQDRTWKVHKALLASRLRFFERAFYGRFVEAASGVVEFPEADPGSVDIMLRHLYSEAIDVKTLKTPVLCVRCWKVANYLKINTLKAVAISILHEHLDAMALLATNDLFFETFQPNWLELFFDASDEVYSDIATEPLRRCFITFLWVSRDNMMHSERTMEFLETHPEANRDMLYLLGWSGHSGLDWNWIPDSEGIVSQISGVEFGKEKYLAKRCCSGCYKDVDVGKEPRFYNPFPIITKRWNIGDLMWCKKCVDRINEDRIWPWRTHGSVEREKVKVEAWAISEDE